MTHLSIKFSTLLLFNVDGWSIGKLRQAGTSSMLQWFRLKRKLIDFFYSMAKQGGLD